MLYETWFNVLNLVFTFQIWFTLFILRQAIMAELCISELTVCMQFRLRNRTETEISCGNSLMKRMFRKAGNDWNHIPGPTVCSMRIENQAKTEILCGNSLIQYAFRKHAIAEIYIPELCRKFMLQKACRDWNCVPELTAELTVSDKCIENRVKTENLFQKLSANAAIWNIK